MKFHIFNIFYIYLLFLCTTVHSNEDESQWLDVDAWSREPHDLSVYKNPSDLSTTSDCGQCQAERANDNTVALIYYRKFIKNLFNRHKLQYDKSSAVYERTVYFTLNVKQLEQLETLKNARDLDIVLSEVFSNARTTTCAPAPLLWGVPAFIWNALKAFAQLLKISEVQFMLYAAASLLFVWFVHRRYSISLISVIVGVFFISGYMITYMECNRELEAKHFLEKQKHLTKRENTPRWFDSIFNLFGSADPVQEDQKVLIKNMSKLRLPFCRPDHVFMMMVNDIFLKQLELLIEKTSTTILAVKTNLPFPFNYLAPLALVGLIAYILKLTFKYILSPRAWAPFFKRGSHAPPPPPPHGQHHQQLPTANSGVAHLTEDRVSGENLRLLLDAVKRPVVIMQQDSTISLSTRPSSSGLQVIQEPTETSSETSLNSTANQDSTSAADTSTSAVSNAEPSSSTNNNNNNNSRGKEEKSENRNGISNTKL